MHEAGRIEILPHTRQTINLIKLAENQSIFLVKSVALNGQEFGWLVNSLKETHLEKTLRQTLDGRY